MDTGATITARRIFLRASNISLHLAHQVHIAFILFGWMFCSTRILHLIAVLLTLFSWYALGPLLGKGDAWGYCVITDLQWQVRERLGRESLRGGYVKYLADRLCRRDFDESRVDVGVAIAFFVCIFASVASLVWYGSCPLFGD